MVVNYDLPWNPHNASKQRIGRCHRYGQKYDVVVVNFLNRKNAADRRVYELLDEKFRLFNGIFGASDEVWARLNQEWISRNELRPFIRNAGRKNRSQFEFDPASKRNWKPKLLQANRMHARSCSNNFDQEVVEKVRIQSHDFLDRFNQQLYGR